MVCYLSGAKPYLNKWLQIVEWILGNEFNIWIKIQKMSNEKYLNQNTENVS